MSTQKSSPNPQSLSAALTEAQTIIESAEKRAAELRGAAERAFEDARDSGYAAGYRRGQQEVAESAIRMIEDSSAIGEKLSTEAAKLAMAICQNVIGEHVKVDPALVKQIATRALQQSIVGDSVTILVNPADRNIIEAEIDHFRRLASGASVKLEAEPTLTPGGCIIRTEFGEVDASVEMLLQNVKTRLGL